MENALEVWYDNFNNFVFEGVKPVGKKYSKDHRWLENQRVNSKRGLRNRAAFEKLHSDKTEWQENLGLLEGFLLANWNIKL
jgi:hypothetical protein